MKNKKLIISLIVLFIIIIIILFVFIRNNNNDDKSTMMNIKDSYNIIEKNINNYNSVRENLIEDINDYYSNNLENDYNKFIDNLNKEEKIIKEIKDEINTLDKLCLDRLFKDKEVNKICNNYKVYYETISNVYMNDINKINLFINNYNKEYEKKFDNYKSLIIEDYIDYNKDGKYLERVDNNG